MPDELGGGSGILDPSKIFIAAPFVVREGRGRGEVLTSHKVLT